MTNTSKQEVEKPAWNAGFYFYSCFKKSILQALKRIVLEISLDVHGYAAIVWSPEIAYADSEVMVMAEKIAKRSITFKVDAAGRLVASKAFREKLHAGDIVEIDEGVIKIKPNKGQKKADKEPTPSQIEAMRIIGKKAVEDYKAGKTIAHEEIKRMLNLK